MFELGSFFDAEEDFEDQFEEDGPDFLYRRTMRAAPVRVTASERDRFVETFTRKDQLLSQACFGGVIVLWLAMLGSRSVSIPSYWTFATFGLLLIAMIVVRHRLWNAPAHALRGRTPVGPGRSGDEIRNRTISGTSWLPVVGMLAFTSFFIFISLPGEDSPMTARNWVFLAMAGLGLLASLRAASRKLRFNR